MKKILITAVLFTSLYNVNAQSATHNLADIDARTKRFAAEVFANCPSFTGADYLSIYAEYINRVEVVEEAYSPNESYALLSKVPLKNKCNPKMSRDEASFNPNTFNPLKYFFNYYPKVDTRYRVDNSKYVILIHPKH